jgi:tetratricopeptide (TPR) repeat protein
VTDARRIFVGLALAVGLLLAAGVVAPVALAQRPPGPTPVPNPSPTPPAPGAGSNIPSAGPSSIPQPDQTDLVLYLAGRVATSDSTALPANVLVERVCNSRVIQQIYASLQGDFRMQLAANTESAIDASADPLSMDKTTANPLQDGIPRRRLAGCELRASASGFHSSAMSLMDLDVLAGTANVGAIVLERLSKINGATLSAAPYMAPTPARKAYEKGLEAEQKNKLDGARKDFEKAVEIYPKFMLAWFQLGSVLEKQGYKEEARAAYTRATTMDAKFLAPYLSLAAMAYEAQDWDGVLRFTTHILDLDPWNHRDFNGYMVNLDTVNYAEAYFYDAVAKYQLNRFDAAEKSAVKAEHLDTRTRHPELHLVMAEILARKSEYAAAISELQTYFELVPGARQLDELQKELAEWEKRSGAVANREPQ